MKNIVSVFSLMVVLVFASCATSQTAKSALTTESFTVAGVCGMCKKRIEMAAFGIRGVNSAVYNVDKQTLTVTFDGQKANVPAIQQQIAAAGHDTEKYKSTDVAYGRLPACCKYKEGGEKH